MKSKPSKAYFILMCLSVYFNPDSYNMLSISSFSKWTNERVGTNGLYLFSKYLKHNLGHSSQKISDWVKTRNLN